jgi:hypothetical protein
MRRLIAAFQAPFFLRAESVPPLGQRSSAAKWVLLFRLPDDPIYLDLRLSAFFCGKMVLPFRFRRLRRSV